MPNYISLPFERTEGKKDGGIVIYIKKWFKIKNEKWNCDADGLTIDINIEMLVTL